MYRARPRGVLFQYLDLLNRAGSLVRPVGNRSDDIKSKE